MAEAASILVAGGTGDLGGRIAEALIRRGAEVRALVRRGAAPEKLERLRRLGVTAAAVDYNRVDEIAAACSGVSCLVSALSGLREVIVEAQTRLLEGAVKAGVPRFIPSDYCIDFTKLPVGSNRNLDLRREFKERLDTAPIAATSVLCGMFAELLIGPAPVVLFKFKRVLYWHDADQLLDFTTKDDVAGFTAAAALDPTTPRVLHVVGEQISARGLASVLSGISGERYRLVRAGGLRALATYIRIGRTLFPQPKELYPAWQGMQYLHNMFSGDAKLEPRDNHRYPELHWHGTRDILMAKAVTPRAPPARS
jgi:nucleoside-diphosphate-sugar epimerase